jgi:hypothetical protein
MMSRLSLRAAGVAALLFALIVALRAAPASAQGQNKSRRLLLETFEIEGEVQKPQITILISRQNLNTDATLELRESFVPRIVESVQKKPF